MTRRMKQKFNIIFFHTRYGFSGKQGDDILWMKQEKSPFFLLLAGKAGLLFFRLMSIMRLALKGELLFRIQSWRGTCADDKCNSRIHIVFA